MSTRTDVFVCAHQIYKFKEFVVQKGMLFGYIKDLPFVSNGHLSVDLQGEYYPVYLLDRNSKCYEWERVRIRDGKLFSLISKGVRRRGRRGMEDVEYLEDAQKPFAFECRRMELRKINNGGSVIHGNCKSNHYYYQMRAPECLPAY